MGEPELQTSLLIAHSASGDRIQLLGQRQCTYSFHDASAQGNSYVANTPSNLLGAEWIVKMGIYALMDCLPSTEPGQQAEINASIADQTSNNVAKQLQRDYPHAFSDKFGLYKMSSATLQLKPGAKPVFRPKRRVPYAAQHAVDKELDRLESIGVISKHVFINTIRALPVTADENKEATTNDRLLQLIKTYIKGKWPKSISNAEIQCFYNRRDSLSMLSRCLLLAERVVIPKNLQQRVLRQLHHGHPGIVLMKALARSYAYWPGIDKDVEDTVRR
ncbi:hypothetical protein Aduo_019035 [Ancylostoma duodenale]